MLNSYQTDMSADPRKDENVTPDTDVEVTTEDSPEETADTVQEQPEESQLPAESDDEIPAADPADFGEELSVSDMVREEVEAAAIGLSDDNPDKVAEYFETKRVIKTLRRDLKDYKDNHELADEFEALNKKVKEIRDKIKTTDEIAIVTEKIATLKERMDLLKEIIKMELMQLEQEEIKHDGRKLKLIQTLKEMKDEEES
ncbi:MAG: hypothetical protein TR69_WS6001001490 [candidate division WS6 bacterium OLB20]|uniref:Uncharacterized protein n=1 Tax=candidate division WS6 bacterium OLB20 TaxID=1617426 RepID=A0A136LW39_9BACT|nr:MAG: hypothetical protein TR69_WS6001001490 [candidate division WS6 bacterium OLB20]